MILYPIMYLPKRTAFRCLSRRVRVHGYANTTDLTRRWQVDRKTARTALDQAGVLPSTVHASPRYAWADILRKIEGWPDQAIALMDLSVPLRRTAEIAEALSVSCPTVRNYGSLGRLHEVRLTERTVRYAMPHVCENQSEEKTEGSG
ncbi:hypothetical protein SAMN06273572_1194 [Monaibacterium marinum]|uniref:Uncharacterized protein n=1 Tax=Pontivivens marinum TaxID=1690039 RepID=A0A2C9CWN4_9RHOB|nr:hypothetical protein SAMN06273572_1194 [Monaibacterium marinum]